MIGQFFGTVLVHMNHRLCNVVCKTTMVGCRFQLLCEVLLIWEIIDVIQLKQMNR